VVRQCLSDECQCLLLPREHILGLRELDKLPLASALTVMQGRQQHKGRARATGSVHVHERWHLQALDLVGTAAHCRKAAQPFYADTKRWRGFVLVFDLLNLLVLVAHGILERGDRLSQRCLVTTARREPWHTFRTTMWMILVVSWTQLLLIYLDEASSSP